MSESHTITYDLQVNIDEAARNLRKAESQLISILSLTRRLSGSDALDDLLIYLLKVYQAALALYTLLLSLQALRASMGDPTAWGSLIIAGGGLAISTAQLMELGSPAY